MIHADRRRLDEPAGSGEGGADVNATSRLVDD